MSEDNEINGETRTPHETKQKPPMKLCFRQKVDSGRSQIVPFRPKTYGTQLTLSHSHTLFTNIN